MKRQKLSLQVIKITLIMLPLVGCGAPAAPTLIPTSTLIPPTFTPVPPTVTKIPPTNTPVPTPAISPTKTPPTMVTKVEMLIGNWQPVSGGRDSMFLQINSDGTCRQSFSLDGVKNTPEVECTYTFENSVLSMTAIKLMGVPACPSPTGSYEVQLAANDQIQLVATEDSCSPRRRSTQGKYQLIP